MPFVVAFKAVRPSVAFSLTLLRPNLGEKRGREGKKRLSRAKAVWPFRVSTTMGGASGMSLSHHQLSDGGPLPPPSLLSLECARSPFPRFPFPSWSERGKVTGPCLKGSNLA